MNDTELSDKLNRAYIMEEQMTGLLIDLCQPEVLPSDLTIDIRKRIESILLSIKADTLRHKKVVLELKDKIK